MGTTQLCIRWAGWAKDAGGGSWGRRATTEEEAEGGRLRAAPSVARAIRRSIRPSGGGEATRAAEVSEKKSTI